MEARKNNLSHVLDLRVNALVEDGYLIIEDDPDGYFRFIDLIHKRNGNRISIAADLRHGGMIQRSNGKVVYNGAIQP